MVAMMNSRVRVSAGFLLLFVASGFFSSSAPAQIMPGRTALLGESRTTANRLAATDKLAADKQWPEAVDEYLHILEEAGDDLVPLDSAHYVCARRLCHQRLAALPADALRMYRDRVESQAKKWFEQGKMERDPHMLLRLVDEAFCSRYTDQALDLLGDLAFERGRFEEAESWWCMIVLPLAPGAENQSNTDDLVYPDPQVDIARVRVKQLLARLFAGNRDDWLVDLKAFRHFHEHDQGDLAGQSGKYTDIVEAIAKQPELQKAIGDRRNQPRPWSTFAGDSSRNFVAPEAPRHLDYDRSPDSPWPIRLGDQPAGMEGLAAARRARNLSIPPPQPPFFPVITGDWVIVAGPDSVTAYDILTGRKAAQFDLHNLGKTASHRPIIAGQAGYTVTVEANSPGRIFAKLGTENPEGRGESHLVCLDLSPPSDSRFHLRWHHSASTSDSKAKETETSWEGSPLVTGGQVFIARTGTDKGITSVDCHDADDGHLRWRRQICQSAADWGTGAGGPRNHLLTLAGTNLIYCSDAGVLVALEAPTGRRTWAYRYSSRGFKTDDSDPSTRGLTPVIYDSGRVYAAPADCDAILCLDSRTGQRLWERKGIEVVHMLGVSKGKLIITTAKTEAWKAGIRALEGETGADIRGWILPQDSSSLLSYGRGFLAGDWVFWPTVRNTESGPQKDVLILNQEDGQPALDAVQFWQLRAGNMAFGNGCLAVADDQNLYLYAPPARLAERSGVR
jgi:outer membrane protein assembly factor BamB